MTIGGGTAVGSAIIIASSVGVDTVSFGTTLVPSTGAKVIGTTGLIVGSNKLISGISQIFNGIYGREVKKGLNPIKDTLIYINPSGEYRDFYNALEVVTEVGVGQLAPYAIGINKDKINPNRQNGNNLFYDGRKVYTEKELNNLEKIKAFQSGKSQLHEGKQGKHVAGHNNFQQGKSEVDMETAKNILNDFQGTGVLKNNGQREVVDTYGKYTGIFVDKDTGQRSITSRFTIHYDSKGTAHIVPANPNSK